MWFMTIALCIPIMWILMLVECTIRVPIVETMTILRLCICIPNRTLCLYIIARMLRRVLCREIGVQLTYICTIITSLAHYIAPASSVFAK